MKNWLPGGLALAGGAEQADAAVRETWRADRGVLAGRGDPEPPRKHVAPRSLLDTMLRIRARALTSIAVPVQAAAARWSGSR